MADKHELEHHAPDGELAHVPVAHFELAPVKKHESSNIQLAPIVKTTAWMFAIIFISQLLVFGLLKYWGARHRAEQVPQSPLLAITPAMKDSPLQVDEQRALRAHKAEAAAAMGSYEQVAGAPGRFVIPVTEAMQIIAKSGKLPEGPEWSLRPDEKMVGGVILNPEQVKYANTPPSQAQVEDYSKPGTLMTPMVVSPAGTTEAAKPAATAAAAATAPAKPTEAKPAAAKPAPKPAPKPTNP